MPPTGEKLLQYVSKNNLKEATKALADGADVNFQDPDTGNSALHLAVGIKNQALAKLMIIFDIDLTLKNKQGKTALALAQELEGAAEIAEDIKTIFDLEKDLDLDEQKILNTAVRNPDAALLLSLDGGGIHGLVFIQVMIEMENRRKKRYPESGENTLLKQFNWLTGNSAGGISVLALAGPNDFDAKKGRKLFFTLKDKVIGGTPPIPNEKVDGVFEDVYKDIYGKPKAMMSDIKDRNVSVMTTLCNQSPPQLHIMSNYGSPHQKGTNLPEDQLIWKAARATSAVPLYFHPQDEKYLDGGLIANNPTTDAIIDMYEHAKRESKKLELKLVLSLGTGDTPPKDINGIDFKPAALGNFVAKIADMCNEHNAGAAIDEFLTAIQSPKPFVRLLEVVSAQITQPGGQVLKRAKFVSEHVGAKFHRINPKIPPSSFMTTDDRVLIEMLYDVKKYMLEHCRQQIDPVLDYIYGTN